MLTGVESHMPIYYRIIPGSIKDMNTLQDSLANISFMKKASFHSNDMGRTPFLYSYLLWQFQGSTGWEEIRPHTLLWGVWFDAYIFSWILLDMKKCYFIENEGKRQVYCVHYLRRSTGSYNSGVFCLLGISGLLKYWIKLLCLFCNVSVSFFKSLNCFRKASFCEISVLYSLCSLERSIFLRD